MTTVYIDSEANGLYPTKFWVIVCRDLTTNEVRVFDRPYEDNYQTFRQYAQDVDIWVGHNILGYDLPHLRRLVPRLPISHDDCIDTLVVSRLVDFNRPGGHSLEQFGIEEKIPKLGLDKDNDWTIYKDIYIERCIQDTLLGVVVYNKFLPYIESPRWSKSLYIEHSIAQMCSDMEKNGFYFNHQRALELREEIEKEIEIIDNDLLKAFPPRLVFVREVVPRLTKHGTIAKNSVPKVLGPDLSLFSADAPFSLCEWQEFNPDSPKQRVERLNAAGWKPVNKTKGYIDLQKEAGRRPSPEQAKRLKEYETYGWKTDDENLATLPDTAPDGIHKLARRLLLASRVRRLDEWLSAYRSDTHRIHGKFNHIGGWTHRMSHAGPNMGNIPKFDAKRPEKTPYSDRMRALWGVDTSHYLVGVDAESIQLRVLGHYINDKELIDALVSGKKEDGTDPHSVNQRALGVDLCRSRDAAKTFIYAWILGAGDGRIAEVLDCSREAAKTARKNFLDRYPGLVYIRDEIIPQDAARGYFEGFDRRFVRCRGDDQDKREFYMLGGYLQCGEAVVMKHSAVLWQKELKALQIPYRAVNFVHDEWQIETRRDYDEALKAAEVMADSIRKVGEELGLNCPMAGSILNGHGKIAIGDNWMDTH